jgi:hypothetical protein
VQLQQKDCERGFKSHPKTIPYYLDTAWKAVAFAQHDFIGHENLGKNKKYGHGFRGGPKPNSDCAGECQQQFTLPTHFMIKEQRAKPAMRLTK